MNDTIEQCKKCGEKYINTCKNCQIMTSGIDEFIQGIRIKFNDHDDTIFEWISYNQFDIIEEVSKGDFTTIYSATWKSGPLYYNDFEYKYTRKSDKKVALKCLHNSQNISNEFLDEV